MNNILSKTKRLVLQYIHPAFSRPKDARIIVTANCMLKCQMCTFWHQRHKDPSLERIKYWIRELADFGIERIALGGGEPFLRKDLVEIVKEVKSYGMTCGVTTSGYLIGKVPFPPVDRCEISIDGVNPETHDKIRGIKGCWERAINAIQIAREHCEVHQLNFVLQEDNYEELPDFCRLAKQFGVPVVAIPVSLKLAAQPSVSDNLAMFGLKNLKNVIDEAMKVGNLLNSREFFHIFLDKLENGPCPQQCMTPYRCILIFADGDVYPCGNLDIPADNLSEGKHLKQIYHEYKELRSNIWSANHERCNSCTYPDIVTRKTLLSGVRSFVGRKFNRN